MALLPNIMTTNISGYTVCLDFCGLIFRFGALRNDNKTQRNFLTIRYTETLLKFNSQGTQGSSLWCSSPWSSQSVSLSCWRTEWSRLVGSIDYWQSCRKCWHSPPVDWSLGLPATSGQKHWTIWGKESKSLRRNTGTIFVVVIAALQRPQIWTVHL